MKFFYVLFSALSFSCGAFALSPITGATDVCIDATIALSDSAGGGAWASGNTSVATINSITGVLTGISAGTVSVTYTEGGNSAYAIITVHPFVTPSVVISASPGDTVCAGTSVTFTAVPLNGGTLPVYLWRLNHSVASITNYYTYFPGAGDTITVNLLSNAACASPDTAFNRIIPVVNPALIPAFDINANPGIIIGQGEYDTLTAVISSGGSSFTYEWIVNSKIITGATGFAYITDSLADNDSVTCIVTSVGPCGGEATFNSVTITVGPSGLKTLAGNKDFTMFPNPNNGAFTIKGSMTSANGDEAFLDVKDVLGRTVYSAKIAAPGGVINEQVEVGSLPGGIYLLELRSGDENRVFRFVIR